MSAIVRLAPGVVKVTPAHDFNDYQVGLRHNLPMINLFTPEQLEIERLRKEVAKLKAERAPRAFF